MSLSYPLMIVYAAAITNLVKITLCHHSVSVYPPQVETNQGVVTVEGKARSAEEKDLITQLVSNVHGVTTVQNRMCIEKPKSR